MILPDANILIYAFRREFDQHPAALAWLQKALAGHETIGLAVPVELAFLRLMTKPLGSLPAAPWPSAWAFIETLTAADRVRRIHAGQGHAALFAGLCVTYGAAGSAITDIYIAALALEHHATLVSADKGFGRFREIRRANPLAPGSH